MIFNPKPGSHGKKHSANKTLPSLNPEIRKWFEKRQKHLKIVKTTSTPKGQTIDWTPHVEIMICIRLYFVPIFL